MWITLHVGVSEIDFGRLATEFTHCYVHLVEIDHVVA